MSLGRRQRVAIVVTAVALVAAGTWMVRARQPAFLFAHSPETATPPTTGVIPQPTLPPSTAPPTLPPPDLGRPALPEPGPAVGLKIANGQPMKPAIEFTSSIPIPEDLVFVLALGSDARPKEDITKTRADSIHLIAVNPKSMQGTVVGFPRDAYVEFPNGRRGKINDALARGGPTFMAETVRKLTGLPIHYVLLTGFVGFQKMVDELGGLDMFVERRMNDRLSGARFQPGWHHFVGGEALAYSRNRHDVPYGDFSRSENQGRLMLAALGKLRSEVADDAGLLHWVGVMAKWTRVDVPADHLPRLAALARRLEPEKMNNVVLPGRVGYAGGASVVFLTQDAPRLFNDLRDDAVIGAAGPPVTTSTSTSTTAKSSPPSTSTPTTSEPATTTTDAGSTTTTLVP